MSPAPTSPSDLTADWLGTTLGLESLKAFQVEPLGATGMAARVFRLRLEGGPDGAPKTVIAKFAAEPGPTLDLAVRFNLYEREAHFYSTLAADPTVPAARAYFAALPGAPFVLLLEEVTGAGGDPTRGATLEQAARLIERMAEMHARFWGDPLLLDLPWLPPPDAPVILDLAKQSSVRSWRRFKAGPGSQLPSSLMLLGDRLSRDHSVLHRLAAPPWTLTHGDLRIDNVIFQPNRPTEPLAVLDWQTATRGRGPIDVATLFATSLTLDDRRTAEHDLLPLYHSRLLSHGVRNYGSPDCWQDYRLAVTNLFSQVIALAGLTDAPERLAEGRSEVTGERLVAALLDLDVLDLVPPKGLARAVSIARGALPRPVRRAARRVLTATGLRH